MTAMHVNTQIAQHQSPKVRTTGQVRGGGGNGGGGGRMAVKDRHLIVAE